MPVRTPTNGVTSMATFLGSDRLAAPILAHGPDLVFHGQIDAAGHARGQLVIVGGTGRPSPFRPL